MIKTEDISLTEKISWSEWLDSITPIAEKLIGEMNLRAKSVKSVRAWFNDPTCKDSLPPDLPGIYGFFHPDPLNDKPLIKFGEFFELFARIATHLGVHPHRDCLPERLLNEKNSFSGDSSFRTKIARALDILDRAEWFGENRNPYKRKLRGQKSEVAVKINEAINNYRIAWQPMLFGRAELQTWAEWNNDKLFRKAIMNQSNFQARIRPSFDKSLFNNTPGHWKELLSI